MKHLGDITKINGASVPPVNVVIGGSPCQDLSVAGAQKGFDGERSVLFMDQIRIIKEMRALYGKPRFMVWENVPGAFSSNKGADFGAVLTETVRIVEPKAPAVPKPKNGWPTAGCLTGDGVGGKWSIVWRVFDAQFWGVPQRRRRIALIADFGGSTAPEILFERESVYGYPPQSRSAWKTTPSTVKNNIGGSINNRGQVYGNKTETLRAESHGAIPIAYCIQGNCIDRADTACCNGRGWTEGVSYTLNTVDCPAVAPLLNDQGGTSIIGGNNAKVAPTLRAEMHDNIPTVFGFKANMGAKARSIGYAEDISPTLSAGQADASVFLALENHPQDSRVKIAEDNVVQTLSIKMGTGGGNTPMIFALDRAAYNQGQNAQFDIGVEKNGPAYTVLAKGPGAVCIGNDQSDQPKMSDVCSTLDCMHDQKAVIAFPYGIVRRLTPLECERLQGYPDGWTEIGEVVGYIAHTDESGHEFRELIYEYTDSKGKKRKVTDSARYKALGNSISLPNWFYVLQKLSICCGADVTMASLFDGIGGFPLIWETLNGKGSCLWASEIEDFPIAVTKLRFKQDNI